MVTTQALYIDHGQGAVRNPAATLDDFKQSKRQQITAALDTIDQKSIRPAREGETARLAELTTQAVNLRARLVTVGNAVSIEEVEAISA